MDSRIAKRKAETKEIMSRWVKGPWFAYHYGHDASASLEITRERFYTNVNKLSKRKRGLKKDGTPWGGSGSFTVKLPNDLTENQHFFQMPDIETGNAIYRVLQDDLQKLYKHKQYKLFLDLLSYVFSRKYPVLSSISQAVIGEGNVMIHEDLHVSGWLSSSSATDARMSALELLHMCELEQLSMEDAIEAGLDFGADCTWKVQNFLTLKREVVNWRKIIYKKFHDKILVACSSLQMTDHPLYCKNGLDLDVYFSKKTATATEENLKEIKAYQKQFFEFYQTVKVSSIQSTDLREFVSCAQNMSKEIRLLTEKYGYLKRRKVVIEEGLRQLPSQGKEIPLTQGNEKLMRELVDRLKQLSKDEKKVHSWENSHVWGSDSESHIRRQSMSKTRTQRLLMFLETLTKQREKIAELEETCKTALAPILKALDKHSETMAQMEVKALEISGYKALIKKLLEELAIKINVFSSYSSETGKSVAFSNFSNHLDFSSAFVEIYNRFKDLFRKIERTSGYSRWVPPHGNEKQILKGQNKMAVNISDYMSLLQFRIMPELKKLTRKLKALKKLNQEMAHFDIEGTTNEEQGELQDSWSDAYPTYDQYLNHRQWLIAFGEKVKKMKDELSWEKPVLKREVEWLEKVFDMIDFPADVDKGDQIKIKNEAVQKYERLQAEAQREQEEIELRRWGVKMVITHFESSLSVNKKMFGMKQYGNISTDGSYKPSAVLLQFADQSKNDAQDLLRQEISRVSKEPTMKISLTRKESKELYEKAKNMAVSDSFRVAMEMTEQMFKGVMAARTDAGDNESGMFQDGGAAKQDQGGHDIATLLEAHDRLNEASDQVKKKFDELFAHVSTIYSECSEKISELQAKVKSTEGYNKRLGRVLKKCAKFLSIAINDVVESWSELPETCGSAGFISSIEYIPPGHLRTENGNEEIDIDVSDNSTQLTCYSPQSR